MTKKKFYITTAIAYPNGKPHMGHALEIVQADCLTRFHKLSGKDVWFQTGTDEHGVKNWQTAKKEGKDIIQFLDENVKHFLDLYSLLNIKYDYFIRTTDKKVHYPGAQLMWDKLTKQGDIYKTRYTGLYCVGCESFKTEKDLVDNKCPNHPTRELEEVEEENYFFKLSKYKDEVYKIIDSDKYKIVPFTRKNEILSFLKDAKDVSFSRPKKSLPWGVPVPNDPDHVMYVWCDALSNYVTGVGFGRDEKMFKEYWPADIHVIGKDILRFHAGIWPAMLLSAKVKLPKELFVHGYINMSGVKMGKSTGNVLDPVSQINKYGVDQFRYYIVSLMPFEGDGEYSENILVERIDSELSGNFSNFCYRVLSFVNKQFSGNISEVKDTKFCTELTAKFENVITEYEKGDFKEAVSKILEISSLGNKYFQENEPWKTVKTDREKTQEVLTLCVNLVKNLCILLKPILPSATDNLEKQLKLENLTFKDLNFKLKNHKVSAEEMLFKRVEVKTEKSFPLSLIVGKIIEVKNHPNADKLYILKVDLKEKVIQLVAGIKAYYKTEEILSKKIIVVSNLEHAKLRGEESQGMLLACEEDGKVGLLTTNLEAGTEITIDGFKNSSKEISYKEFQKLDLNGKNGLAYFENYKINHVYIEKVKNGAIH